MAAYQLLIGLNSQSTLGNALIFLSLSDGASEVGNHVVGGIEWDHPKRLPIPTADTTSCWIRGTGRPEQNPIPTTRYSALCTKKISLVLKYGVGLYRNSSQASRHGYVISLEDI